MPQVPYNPVPEVAPSDNPLPRDQQETPFAAFGGTVAEATSHLGQAVSGAGDELFTRAMAMQDLYNHSQALEADTDFAKAAGDVHAKLSSMQGKDAVDYYNNGYIDDLNKARNDIRDGLPNDMARKIYDQSSLGTYGRTVFNGAGHAADANKNYAIGTAAAKVKESQNAALAAPADEAGFQQHLQDTVDNTTAQYQLKGADQDTINAATHKAVSDLYISRITGLAKTQPFMADKILSQAVADGKIEGDDLGRITNTVQTATRTVGARNISDNVRSGSDLSPGAGVVSIGAAKNAIGSFESGNNYQSQGVEVPGRGRALGKYQVMPENLDPWLKEAGLPSMTTAEFLASPSAQDKVFETHFGGLMTKYGNFNDAASEWFSGKPAAQAGDVKDANGTTVPSYLANTNRYLAQGMSLGDQVSRGRAQASSMAPDDPLLGDFVQQRITQDYHEQLQVKRDDDFNNRQTVEAALIGGDQQGNLPTTLDQLKADPKVEAAWDKLEPSEQRRYLGIMAKLDKNDVAMTPDRLKEYQRLKGEAQSDPAAFLDEDVVGANLPINVRKELINDQIKKKANAEADPRVTQALQVLRPTMDAAGISRTSDQQGYDQFVGSLQGALEDFNSTNKRPANAKEVGEIGQRLLQSVPGTGWFSNDKVYNVAVPDAERTKILSDPFWTERGITPTDDQVQRIYARQTYQKLYGGKTKADATPSVPMSK